MDTHKYFGNSISANRFVYQTADKPKPAVSEKTEKTIDMTKKEIAKAAETESGSEGKALTDKTAVRATGKEAKNEAKKQVTELPELKIVGLTPEGKKRIAGERVEKIEKAKFGELIGKLATGEESAEKKLAEVAGPETSEQKDKFGKLLAELTGEEPSDDALRAARRDLAEAEFVKEQSGKKLDTKAVTMAFEEALAQAKTEQTQKLEQPARFAKKVAPKEAKPAEKEAVASAQEPKTAAEKAEVAENPVNKLNSRERKIYEAIKNLDRDGLKQFAENINARAAMEIGMRINQGEKFGAESTNIDIAKIIVREASAENLLDTLKTQAIASLTEELNNVSNRNDIQKIAERYGVSGFLGFGGTAEINSALKDFNTDRGGTIKKIANIIYNRGDKDKLGKLM
jgi:hypothetical protein